MEEPLATARLKNWRTAGLISLEEEPAHGIALHAQKNDSAEALATWVDWLDGLAERRALRQATNGGGSPNTSQENGK